MKSFGIAGSVLVFLTCVYPVSAQKESLNASITARADAAWDMAQKIWTWSETGYQEKRSAALLADTLEAAGFVVVAEEATAAGAAARAPTRRSCRRSAAGAAPVPRSAARPSHRPGRW